MNAQWRQKWLEALESGKYQQTTARLQRENLGFCCLGVLCDIVDPTRWDITPGASIEYHLLATDENFPDQRAVGSMPPSDILNLVGLKIEDAQMLARMNDNGDSFSMIADRIRNRL